MQSKSHGTDRDGLDKSSFYNLSCNMKLLSEPCQHGNRRESPQQLWFNEESPTHAWGREP